MVREYRYAIQAYSRSFPKGAHDEQEPLVQACRREVYEETGVDVADWQEIGVAMAHEAMLDIRFHYFFGQTMLLEVPAHTADEEVLEARFFRLAEIDQMLLS
ncbi:MAG: NUDIX hydrolase [Candidatus Peribacteria bacterium]|nr:MAG: NUDIX hydrolase [Candidatus Peribacteria bacterium]